MTKRLLAMLTVLCMLIACLPVAAAAEAAQAAETKPVEIKLSIGSPTVTINGVASTIQKPVKENGTTLVPLSVITKAFGAKLKLENNKVITLTYNSTVVVLTIGSDKVTVNGTVSKLAAAPKIVNGVTMVPVRVIAQAFGASVGLNGNQITIKGLAAKETGGGTGSGIDSDAGKSKVGDSYYGWSMNYPTELTLGYQSEKGDWSVWSNVTESQSLTVSIEEVEEEYSKEELREEMMMYFDNEIILEKKSVTVKGVAFEKIVTKSRDGWFYEYRATQKDQRVYYVMAAVQAASRDALTKYQSLLDSFTPSFNKNDRALKDVTKVKDGMIQVQDEDFGIKLTLPINWTSYVDEGQPYFYSKDGSMEVSIKSVQEGETAEQWRERSRAKIEGEFAEGYLRNVAASTIQLKNGTGQLLSYEYSWNKKDWSSQYDVFLIAGAHKYEINFDNRLEDTAKGKQLFEKIVGSLEIDTKYVDENFSEMEEEEATEEAFVKKTSKKYGYSIEIPSTWSGYVKDFEREEVMYETPEGMFMAGIEEDTTINKTVEEMREELKELEDDGEDVPVIKQTTQVTIDGISMTRVDAEMPDEDRPSNIEIYMVEKNGDVYFMTFEFYQANNTEAFRARVDKVVKSFKFTS